MSRAGVGGAPLFSAACLRAVLLVWFKKRLYVKCIPKIINIFGHICMFLFVLRQMQRSFGALPLAIVSVK